MTKFSKFMGQNGVAALLIAGAITIAAFGASAAVVCDHEGDCWHTHERYHYPVGFGITVHPDNWNWHGDRYHRRENEGRGYWPSGVGITL